MVYPGARKFYPRRASNQRRRRARRARYGRTKTQIKGFSPTQAQSLVRYMGRNEETKYMATQLHLNTSLDAAIHSIGQPATGSDWMPLVPKISVGVGENQRIGREVKPIKCRVDVALTFNQNIGEATAYTQFSQQIYAVMYILRPKAYKNYALLETAGSTFNPAPWGQLLDYGDGTSGPFGQIVAPGVLNTNTSHLQLPIETSEFTLVRKKIVKLTRNGGEMNWGLPANQGPTPNLPSSSFKGSFSFKLPKLKYDDTQVNFGGYPTNTALSICFGYVTADNLNSPNSGQPLSNLLNVTSRAHIWYKDA